MLKTAGFVLLASIAGAQDLPRQWLFHPGDQPLIEHVLPGTADSDFTASCRAGSGILTVTPGTGPRGLAIGEMVIIGFGVDDGRARYYPAIGVKDAGGGVIPAATFSLRDPNFTALANGTTLTILLDRSARLTLPLAGIAGPLRAFGAACAG